MLRVLWLGGPELGPIVKFTAHLEALTHNGGIAVVGRILF